MRAHWLIGLFAVTAVAVIVAILVSLPGGPPLAGPLVGTPVVADLAKRLDAAAQVAIVQTGAKATLVKKGEQWSVEELGGYPAEAKKIRAALAALSQLTYQEPKTRKPDLYARLEVEDAGKPDGKSTLVTVADDKGALVAELVVGKRRASDIEGGGESTYVRKPGDAQSWLARGSVDIPANPSAWVDHKIIDLPEAEVTEAQVTQPDGTTATIRREDGADGKLKLVELPAAGKLKRESLLDDTMGGLAGLELQNVRSARDEDFPKDGTVHDRFTAKDGLVVTIELAEKDNVAWARFAATASGAAEERAKTLNAKLSGWEYAIPKGKTTPLTAKLADFLEPAKGS
jgi:hypothetical protein